MNIPKFIQIYLPNLGNLGSFHFGGIITNRAAMNILVHAFGHKYIGNY